MTFLKSVDTYFNNFLNIREQELYFVLLVKTELIFCRCRILRHVCISVEVPIQAIESSIRDMCINMHKQKFSACYEGRS